MNNKFLTIVVPMAGRGSRFAQAGYLNPKPLIPINGIPMIKVVIDNLTPSRPHRFVFICQQEHVRKHDLKVKLNQWAPGSALVELTEVTQGAACTVLKAIDFLDTGPLMIANSDQYVDRSIDDYLRVQDEGLDGLIMTMTANDPKWSFVALNSSALVTRVVEKEVISNEATVGIYNFARGTDFVLAANQMIERNERVNGEFYVAPVYNELISTGAKIGIYNVGSEADGMYGLGTPRDLDLFLSSPVSQRATKA